MAQYTALSDANVLYPAPLRDILLQLAVEDLFRAKWSADIHRDCLGTGYVSLVTSLELPDPDDRHVLATAIVDRAESTALSNRAIGSLRNRESGP
jgi:hypothetical protein